MLSCRRMRALWRTHAPLPHESASGLGGRSSDFESQALHFPPQRRWTDGQLLSHAAEVLRVALEREHDGAALRLGDGIRERGGGGALGKLGKLGGTARPGSRIRAPEREVLRQ